MKKITTHSGAVYHLHEDGKITGGSKELVNGKLLVGPYIGASMYIDTPERGGLNPTYRQPGVITSYVVEIEEVEDD